MTTETESFTLQDVREQTGEVEASDVDGDTLNFTVTTDASHGTLTIDETGAWTYNVDGIYMGEDSAIITVDDGNDGRATKTLNFNSVITPPIVTDYALNILEDNSFSGTIEVGNPSNATLTYSISSDASNGVVTIDENTGLATYTPNKDYNGVDSLSITVTNEYGLSSTSNIIFDIEAVNDTPIVVDDSPEYTMTNVRDLDGNVEASDVDGDVLSYSVATQATNGVVSIDEEGNWHYKADGSFNGSDSATILVDDGNGATVTSTLNFNVEGYIYEGEDLIIDDNGEDTLMMSNVNKHELSFSKDENNMIINVKDGASITLTNYFSDLDSGVQTITTAQGDINLGKEIIKNAHKSWWRGRSVADENMKNLLIGSKYRDYLNGADHSDIVFGENKHDLLRGKAGNDLLIGGYGHDLLDGGEGDDNLYGGLSNDALYGGDGNDALIGGDGHDYLLGGDGDDFLSGGTGYDQLRGEAGDDTYMFEKGDKYSYVSDYKHKGWFSTEDAGNDTVKFGKDITKEDISFMIRHGDLYLQYGEDDSIKINNQTSNKQKIEKFELEDGSYLTHDDVNLVVQQLNAYASDNGIHRINNETIRNNQEMMNIVSSAWNV